jgi:tRNA threonylcarbamoyladenosine biosynthesis protein TsaB
MILYINSSQFNSLQIRLISKQAVLFDVSTLASHSQSEKLLPLIEKNLKAHKLNLDVLTGIKVENRGEGFTNLRIGVTTANTLAFALGIPVLPTSGKALKRQGIQVVKPEYSREPHITVKKTKKA